MAELDLSKAYEAAALGVASDAGRVNTVDRDRVVGPMCVDLALPHILDALASQAHCERVFAGSFPPVKEDAYIVAQWLRAKAEELRGG